MRRLVLIGHLHCSCLSSFYRPLLLRVDKFINSEKNNKSVKNVKSYFTAVCKKHKIKQKFTAAYTSKHNGMAERTNRTIAEGMRSSLIDSNCTWSVWPEAMAHSTFAANRVMRQSKARKGKPAKWKGWTSPYTRMTGLNNNARDMHPFLQPGHLVNEKPKNKKSNTERSAVVRFIGYSTTSKGYILMKGDGSRIHSEFFTPIEGRHPLKQGYTIFEDQLCRDAIDPHQRRKQRKMARQAIEPDPRLTDLNTTAPIDSEDRERPIGFDDSQLRDFADATDQGTVGFKDTTHLFTPQHDEDQMITKAKRPRRGSPAMTRAEAVAAVDRFVASEHDDRETLYAHFNQASMKENNKEDQKLRYLEYKSIKTPKDYLEFVKQKKISKSDMVYDLQKGYVKITQFPTDTAFNLVYGITHGVKQQSLSQMAKRLGRKDHPLMKKESPEVVQNMFDFYHDGLNDDIDLTEIINQSKANDSNSKERIKLLAKHVYAHAITGIQGTEHERLSKHFALEMAREIVCGKVTPGNDREAKASTDWDDFWKPALQKEISALWDMGTFKYVPRSVMVKQGKRPKKTKVVYKIKKNAEGQIDRAKCRLVVQGFSLIHNNEYYESFSSVLSHANMRMLLYISAQTGETISSADVGNAFLEAPLDDVVYVEQHPEFDDPKYPRDEYVLQLKKCLYGLPQAGREYQRVYDKMMKRLGFVQIDAEDCLYVKNDPKHGRIICGNYVDDLLCLTHSTYLRDEWRTALKKEFAKVTFEDDMDFILGIKIKRGKDKLGRNFVELDHQVAIEKVAEAAGIDDAFKPVLTPMSHSIKLHKKTEGEDDESLYVPKYEYARVLGGIMYVANVSRPDLITGVNKLSRYVTNPSHTHYKVLTKLVAHAYQTRDRCLRYTQVPHDQEHDPFRLRAASDSSYADCPDTGRSTIGGCLWMGTETNGLIDWRSAMPKTVAQSTAEAEVQAAIETTKDILYTRELLLGLGYPQIGSTRILVDATAAIAQIKAVQGVRKARHYVVPLRKIQEAYHTGHIHTQQVNTDDNPADAFTKPLPDKAFWRHSTSCLGDAYNDHANVELKNKILLSPESDGGRIKPGVAKTIKNTRCSALAISNEWNPPEVDDGRTTTTGERREWLKEKRKESEREGRRLKDLIRLEELQMMNRMLAMHTTSNPAALPEADTVAEDVRDRINHLERMYNPATGDGNDLSDNDEADVNNDRVESNDRVANEHAALTATESLVNQTDRRTEPHTPGTVPTEATPREQSTCRSNRRRCERAESPVMHSMIELINNTEVPHSPSHRAKTQRTKPQLNPV